jgi:hypothetical protein
MKQTPAEMRNAVALCGGPHEAFGCVSAAEAAERWPAAWRMANADAEWVASTLGIQLAPIGARYDEHDVEGKITVLCELLTPRAGLSPWMFLNVPERPH